MKFLAYLPYAIGCTAGLVLSLVIGAVCGLSDDVKMVESVALVVLGGGVAEWYWTS
ncbi:hypothetical protein [Ensifer adhaerens]|uniref:hypothetical protein n=1 Tax=Ensifer adhaerens TaxID=106592 RepID=UPI001319E49B|nr:hypothetical protein [Ensifer adhaerens]